MASMRIPFLDLVTPHVELEEQLIAVCRQALRTAGFIGGPMVENFERAFAEYCGTRYAVGVSSGTDAVRFALTAAGVKAGDTVVTVPHTFIATTEAITQAGAHIDFVDIDERTYTMSPASLEQYFETRCVRDAAGRPVSRRTGTRVTAIVPVHLYGQMADMDPLLAIARRHSLLVIEDACQAHGAEYYSRQEQKWRKAGSMGHAAAFSFYPGKNLGACGEAGAITTNDEAIVATSRMLREHGQSKKYFHDMEGYNGRLDAIQAGMLQVKLGELPRWTRQRQACAKIYDRLLADVSGVITPHVPEWSRPVYHLYVIRTNDRDGLQAELTGAGIGTGIHYPFPLHLSNAYTSLGHSTGDFPVTEAVAGRILSLPMFPTLDEAAQAEVAAAIVKFVAPSPAAVGQA
jgi:dTDP-4-amino-4,6-dideoxygalactose transaminase